MLSSAVSAVKDSDLPAPPTTVDEVTGLVLNLETGVIGAILMAIGILLTFSGKRFFKVFLALVGFCVGALLACISISFFHTLFDFSHSSTVTYIIAIVCGLILAGVAVMMWKLGVYAAAGLGGYTLMVYILSLKVGGLIEGHISRDLALCLAVIAAVVAAMFLEDIIIAVASAAFGSVAAMSGLDCFLNTGFRAQIYDQAIGMSFKLPKLTGNIYYMFAGTGALAVCGVVVQLLNPSKGYGRSG